MPLLREVMALGEASGDASRLVRAGVAATYVGDDRSAREYWLRAVREARATGALASLSFALEFVAVAEATAGQFAAAYADASEGLQLARETGLERSAALSLATAAWARAVQGREEECRAHADEALALAFRHGLGLVAASASVALARLELGLGRPAEALDRLSALMSAGPGSGHPLVALLATPELVEAAVRSDLIERAQPAFAVYEQWASAAALPWALAVMERCRGLLLSGDAAAEHFENALALHAQSERPFEHARTQLLYGELLRRERRRVDARPHLRAAAETFERLGAEPWAGRATTELRASGETSPPARARRPRRADRAGAPDRPPRRRGRRQQAGRRAALPQPAHRRLPPPQGLPEARDLVPGRAPQARARRLTTGERPAILQIPPRGDPASLTGT